MLFRRISIEEVIYFICSLSVAFFYLSRRRTRMLRNQKVLDELFEEASAAAEGAISQIDIGASRDFVNDELRLTLTALSKRLGTHLEILEALRSEIEAIVQPD
jgi:hypothetical protein